MLFLLSFNAFVLCSIIETNALSYESNAGLQKYKYVVKHKSAKLLKTYALGKLEAALNISH